MDETGRDVKKVLEKNHALEDTIDYQSVYTAAVKQWKISGSELIGLCPFHDDHHPSFNANIHTGLFKCHACGAQGNVVQFTARLHATDTKDAFRFLVKEYGLSASAARRYDDTMSSYPPKHKPISNEVTPGYDDIMSSYLPKHKPTSNEETPGYDDIMSSYPPHKERASLECTPQETVYSYKDGDGTLLYQAVRTDWVEKGVRRKQFHYRYPSKTAKGGFVLKKPKNRVLYGLPAIAAQREHGGLLFVCEGEKCADRVIAQGFLATTTGSATSYSEWTEETTALVENFDLILLPDNDPGGHRYVHAIADRIDGKVKSVKVVDLTLFYPDLPVKGDIADLIDQGESFATLVEKMQSLAHYTVEESAQEGEALLSYPMNDMGNADRFIFLYGSDVRYNQETMQWYSWDGVRWKPDETGQVWRCCLAMVTKFRAAAEQSGNYSARRFALNSGNANKLKGMLEIVSKRQYVLQSMLDTHPDCLSLPRATVRLDTGEETPHKRENFITKALHLNATRTECPLFLAFLETIFDGDIRLISYIQRVFGYCLTGSTREQVFFIAYGTGANGKSTLIDVVSFLLQEYVHTISIDTLMTKERSGNATPEIAKAKGARLVIASESSALSRLNEGQIKQLTGNDAITARPLYAQGFTYKPEFKIWISTNHKPVIAGTDYGIWRRVHLIPFAVTIEESQMDRDLPEKLRAEAPGILNWMLEGARLWYALGLSPPAAVTDAVKAYRSEMDTLEDFIHACIDYRPGRMVSAKDLYAAYCDFCYENSISPETQSAFGRKMGDKGFDKKRKPFVHYMGIVLLREEKSEEESILFSMDWNPLEKRESIEWGPVIHIEKGT